MDIEILVKSCLLFLKYRKDTATRPSNWPDMKIEIMEKAGYVIWCFFALFPLGCRAFSSEGIL